MASKNAQPEPEVYISAETARAHANEQMDELNTGDPLPSRKDDLAVVMTSDGVEHVGVLPANAADTDEAPTEPLPTHKDDLVALAIERGIPSYEAWDMTIPELTKKLES